MNGRPTVSLRVLLFAMAMSAPVVSSQPVFRSSVDAVQLDVSVMQDGRPVTGLTAADFIVTDNGVPQDIRFASLATLPLDVMLVLDVSQSVSGRRLENLIGATDALTRALHEDDRAALLTFSHEIRLRVPMTGNLATIRTALGPLAGRGATSLRDAITLAMALRSDVSTRSLILLFSDGADTASWMTEGEVIDMVRRTGSVIHAVRLDDDRFLDRLAEESGGRAWSATSDRELRTLFTRALDEMRARYLLTYSSPASPEPGWHKLKVRLRNGSGDVTARPGYFVPETTRR